nr:hypothetical protein [Angustibacter aerolatus]
MWVCASSRLGPGAVGAQQGLAARPHPDHHQAGEPVRAHRHGARVPARPALVVHRTAQQRWLRRFVEVRRGLHVR